MRRLRLRLAILYSALFLPVGGVESGALAAGEWRAEGPFFATVVDVAIDAAHPDTLYAGTHGGGVWRSDDGGATWTLPGDEMTSREIKWVAVDPTNSATVWAGVDSPGDPSLWRSPDRGATWDLAPIHAVAQTIAFAPSQPKTIYVASTNLHYRSADGGKTWTDFRVPNQDAYTFAIHPQNPKIIFAGGRGQHLHFSRSEDGGKTWRQTGQGLPERSLSRLLVDHSNPRTLYAAAGFGDLFKSVDMGDNWTALDLGLGGTDDLFQLVMDPRDSQILWATTEDGLKRSRDGGVTWQEVDLGRGTYLPKGLAFHPTRPGVMFAGTAGTGVFRSSDGGSTWTPSSQGLAAAWVDRIYAGSGVLFAQLSIGLFRRESGGSWTEVRAPFSDDDKAEPDGIIFDRSAPRVAYAFDTAKYWRSADGGKSWTAPPTKEPGLRDMMKGNLDTPEFQSLAQDPGDLRTFYAGAWSNDSPGTAIYKTIDAGKNWKPSGTGVPNESIQMLRSAAAKTVFAVVSENGIYRTTDGGASWKSASSGLPSAKLRELEVDPAQPARLYAATEEGFFRSGDSGTSWTKVAGALAEEDVEAVAVSAAGTVYAGTFHGVFQSTDGGATWTAIPGAMKNSDVRALAIEPGPGGRLYAGLAEGSVVSIELP